MPAKDYLPLIEISRGNITESIHSGAIAVVDSTGELLASYGNPETVCFMRSSAKPFQALPFVEMGGLETFGISERELALMCASHAGTGMHVAAAKGILKKLGIEEQALLCGTHVPFDIETAESMLIKGEKPGPLQHNCSGKHLGMLAQSILLKQPIDTYIDATHPVQRNIHAALADMCGLEESSLETGIDGCSVPTFAVPLKNAAYAFARLCDPGRLPAKRANACQRILHAMTTHPEMVSGAGRLDTAIMQTANHTIVCKSGAEAFHAMGLVTDALSEGSPALGIAFKIADGDLEERARPLVALEILRQIGAFSAEQLQTLSDFDFHEIKNQRGMSVGDFSPYFVLDLKY